MYCKQFKEQAGIHWSAGERRMLRILVHKFATMAGVTCHRCGEPVELEKMSIEHIEPWLDSDDPKDLAFNPDNLTISHRSCNSSASRGNTRGIPKSFAEVLARAGRSV